MSATQFKNIVSVCKLLIRMQAQCSYLLSSKFSDVLTTVNLYKNG